MIQRPPRTTRLTHSFPTRRSSDLSTRSIWLDRNSAAGTPKEESSALVLDSIEGLMEKLLEIENDNNTSMTHRDINVLISGSLHLVGDRKSTRLNSSH